MATGKSKSSLAKFKCLSTITLGGNEIRFVGMNEVTNGVHFPKVVKHVSIARIVIFIVIHLFTAILRYPDFSIPRLFYP